MRLGPSPLELKRSDLGRKAVDDAFHFPRACTRSFVGALGEVAIVLAFTAGRRGRRAYVRGAGRRERAEEVASIEGRDCVFDDGRRHCGRRRGAATPW